MPNIRVTCPACKSELELDSAFEGQEVECGNCLEVFTAKVPLPDAPAAPVARRDDEGERDRGSRRTRRRRDDEDDYYPPPRARGGDNTLGLVSLICGILAIFPGCCCGVFAIPLSLGAIGTGAVALQQRNGKELAMAGLVCGIVSLGLIALRFFVPLGFLMFNPNAFR
jgi:hypothetical protein